MLLACAVLALAACSTLRLGYGHAQTLGYWWLDRYADFTPEQAPRVKAALQQWLAWHQRTQLAEDAALLERAAREVQADASADTACAWVDLFERKRNLHLDQLAGAVAEIAPLLSAAQREHMAQRQAKVSAEWRDEHLQADPAERAQAAVQRVLERAEQLYGRLDSAQRRLVAEATQASPWQPERWEAERLADQRATLALLTRLAQERATPEQRLALARDGLRRIAEPGDESLRQHRAQLYRYQCAFSAQLHNRTSAEQRRHAADKLQGWAQDLRSFLPAAATAAPALR